MHLLRFYGTNAFDAFIPGVIQFTTMPWALYNQLAQGVVLPHKTMHDKLTVQNVAMYADGDVWPLSARECFVPFRRVNLARPVMQPNCVPKPAIEDCVTPVPDAEARQRVGEALATVKPVQYWPSEDEFRHMQGEVEMLSQGGFRYTFMAREFVWCSDDHV